MIYNRAFIKIKIINNNIRFLQIDRGHVVIPKSVTKSRIDENSRIFDFKLSSEDIAYIDTFDCNGRICPMSG